MFVTANKTKFHSASEWISQMENKEKYKTQRMEKINEN